MEPSNNTPPQQQPIDAGKKNDLHLSFSFAKNYGVLLEQQKNDIILLHRSGLQLHALNEIQRHLGAQPFQLQALDSEAFQKKLTERYQSNNSDAIQAAEDIGSEINLNQLVDELPDTSDLMDTADDAPVIRLLNAILSQAIREKASDIHIETFEERLVVRFRIDGVLRETLSPKRQLASLLISRLKIMAKLDIAEKRIPQDGRITVRIAGHTVDIRMSTLPSAHGERVVLRLLDSNTGRMTLTDLQMGDNVTDRFKRMLRSAHGIILVTGPTGSGKTTTLYAGLHDINQNSRNIMTIEDPIEYMLAGIGQTQVNPKVDMSFARGLRAILRQDPDVVMVGEIRDIETAEIAVQASLTGHLVLSTLHTNTAIGSITRLQDMGVESFLLSSSLLVVMAQRLVRTLCLECREPYTASAMEQERFNLPSNVTIYRPVGCAQCNLSGYQGRTGIYEFIPLDDTIRSMIHERTSEQAISQYAQKKHPSIIKDGRRRILNGETTVEEVLRVTLV